MRYPNASAEPLEIIRANECEARGGGLVTSRFQALWNEIERLTRENGSAKCEIVRQVTENERLRAALADERERCAKIAEEALTRLLQQPAVSGTMLHRLDGAVIREVAAQVRALEQDPDFSAGHAKGVRRS